MEKALIPSKDIEPITFKEVKELGKTLQESGFFPGISNSAQAVAKIMAGRELGLGPVYSLQMIDLVQGRLRLRSEVMAALINRSAHYSYLIKTLTDQEAVIEFSKDGKPIHISKFTLEDAKRAGLLKPDSGWAKYPKDMLFSRAISAGAKKVCPELMMGMETLEQGGFEEVEGHVVKEGEPPPSSWQAFWGEVKGRGYLEDEAHQILQVVSIKHWLDQGKSLAEALELLPDKQGRKEPLTFSPDKGKEVIAELFGPEEKLQKTQAQLEKDKPGPGPAPVAPAPQAKPEGLPEPALTPKQREAILAMAWKQGYSLEGLNQELGQQRMPPLDELTVKQASHIITWLGERAYKK